MRGNSKLSHWGIRYIASILSLLAGHIATEVLANAGDKKDEIKGIDEERKK